MNCTPCSMKLLDMPLLCKKLGFNKSLDENRVTGLTDFGYNEKVLVGNWLQRRSEPDVGEEDKEIDLLTVYQQDYVRRKGFRSVDELWGNRIYAQGNIELKQGSSDEYLDNKATVYDLAYRWRVRDFVAGNYGNVTNYGKKECLRGYWEASAGAATGALRYHTEYTDAYSSQIPCLVHITT